MPSAFSTSPLDAHPRRQRGAVLVVSLIILLIMTILGIASMSSVTMEEKMAANSMNRNMAFQAAETLIDGVIAGGTALNAAIDNSNVVPIVDNINASDSRVTNSGEVLFLGRDTLPRGWSGGVSLPSGMTWGNFQITGTGQVPAVGASVTTEQGYSQLIPAL